MKLRWKVLIGLLVLLLGAGIYAYKNRVDLILKFVATRGLYEIGLHQEVSWAQGPETADLTPAERPPNIVFILADDLGINDISTFGGGVAGGRIKTPHIDRLAADGAIFTQGYAGNATCAPSRAMLMTGRYPTRTGFEFTPMPPGMGRLVPMISNDLRGGDKHALPSAEYRKPGIEIPYDDQGLPGEEITIAEVLKDKDYHNVHIGKWHLGRSESMLPNAQGFDESLLMHSGLFLPEDDPNVVNAKLDFDPIDRFLWARMQYGASLNGGEPFAPGGYLTDYYTDESLKVIEANKNRPFFLYLAHWGVHTPLQATKEDYAAIEAILGEDESHRLKVYGAMVRSLDRSVGRIMDKLEAEGLADSTIIVFSSDNGGAGYIGLPEVNAPYRGFKITMFEGGIRAPMFVKWPSKIVRGTKVSTPVAHIDVMPTLVAAAGADLPAGVEIDGENIMPMATGEGGFSRKDNALFWQSGYLQVVRAGDWKLLHEGRRDKNWLFNLREDPTEQINLASKNPDKLAELTALLEKHQAGRKPPLYSYQMESPIAIDKTLADTPEKDDVYAWWPN